MTQRAFLIKWILASGTGMSLGLLMFLNVLFFLAYGFEFGRYWIEPKEGEIENAEQLLRLGLAIGLPLAGAILTSCQAVVLRRSAVDLRFWVLAGPVGFIVPVLVIWPFTAIWGKQPGPVEPFTIVGGGLIGAAFFQWYSLRRKGMGSKRWLFLWLAGLPLGMIAFMGVYILIDLMLSISWAAEIGLIGFAIGGCAGALSGRALLRAISGHRGVQCGVVLTLLGMISANTATVAQQLPPGGTTSWEIQGIEEIVTFLLFDPKDPAVALPAGLRFVPAREVKMPEVQDYLKQHPEHTDWAFSVVEITRDKGFLLDGKAPARPENGGSGLWIAPIDPSQLAGEIAKDKFDTIIAPSLGAVLALAIWMPDREYVTYMRARGHHAEYGVVTLTKDGTGAFQGEIKLEDLSVKVSATPQGEVREDPEAGTQVVFPLGAKVENAVVIAGANARNRDCTAEWSKKGNHPLSRGVFVGPTYLTTYPAPLKGSAYRLKEAKGP